MLKSAAFNFKKWMGGIVASLLLLSFGKCYVAESFTKFTNE